MRDTTNNWWKNILPYDIQPYGQTVVAAIFWTIIGLSILLVVGKGVKTLYFNNNRFFYSTQITTGDKKVYTLTCNDSDSAQIQDQNGDYWSPNITGNTQTEQNVQAIFDQNGQHYNITGTTVTDKYVYMKDIATTGCPNPPFL